MIWSLRIDFQGNLRNNNQNSNNKRGLSLSENRDETISVYMLIPHVVCMLPCPTVVTIIDFGTS